MKKATFFLLIFVISTIIISATSVQSIKKIQASIGDNVSGWAWSEKIGWMSFNCLNQDSCASFDYGVDIEEGTGNLSGYAWSENIGWITFNEADLSGCPLAPCKAWVDISCPSNHCSVSGWAKALIDEEGWSGWVRLKDTDYEVWIEPDQSPSEFHGWAWSNDFGWLDFNCLDQSSCASFNYKVLTDFDFNISSVSSTSDFFDAPCAQSRIPVLSWQTDTNKPYDYEIEIDNNSDFTSPEISESVLSTNSLSWIPGCAMCCDIAPFNNILWGGGTYYWRVRVRNATGPWSDWKEDSDGFVTNNHCFPYPDFLCDGADCNNLRISGEQQFTLSDSSTAYGGSSINNCLWSLPSGATIVAGDPLSDCSIVATFNPSPGQITTMTVTDSSGYSCLTFKIINILMPLPEWREIAPF